MGMTCNDHLKTQKKLVIIRPFSLDSSSFFGNLGWKFLGRVWCFLIPMTFVKNVFFFYNSSQHVQPLKGAKIILTISGMFGWK